ncbi:hypothetical protein FAGAP_3737 [Fusarium agapanthi]|uniref:Peptidase S7 domain-containing protein n=1 Tax=Fusarium agapanthi TaxID=1803897 RepID=A0A9P5E8B3_9HYPO|nr:hypothetical protein FAGAP_3737 [Fusarium agapanthi]
MESNNNPFSISFYPYGNDYLPPPCVERGWKRLGWPGLLPLPSKTITEPLPPSVANLEPDIINKAHTVLMEFNIVRDTQPETLEAAQVEVSLEMTQHPFVPGPRLKLTLAIPWPRDSETQIEDAISSMSEWMLQFTSHLPGQIFVEAIAPELLQTIYYDEVGVSLLSDSWDYISNKLMTVLPRQSLTCLSLQRYGVDPVLRNNPPTIYVGLDYNSEESSWSRLENNIKATMRRMYWNGVNVHIEHNLNFSSYTFPVMLPAGDDADQRICNGIDANKRINGDYSHTLYVGADFGTATYLTRTDKARRDSGNGTLGCYIQIKTKTNPAWRTCALTNYHVVRPAFNGFTLAPVPGETGSQIHAPLEDSDLRKVDEWGYKPSMVANPNHKDKNVSEKTLKAPPASFDSPSRAKHNLTLAVIDRDLTAAKQREKRARQRLQSTKDGPEKVIVTTNLQKAKERIEALKTKDREKRDFFNEHKAELGTLLLAAGFKRKVNGRRMDWALIAINPGRPWSNNLPNVKAWASKYDCENAYPDETFGLPLTEQMRSIEGSNGVGRAFKIGSTTGPSVGKFWDEKVRVTLEEDHYLGDANRLKTKECIFAGNSFLAKGEPARFCAKGDSGSVVFDELGGIVGLVFRGHKHHNSYNDGYGYVTPIEHVFEDIMDFSNGQITDIRVAEQ